MKTAISYAAVVVLTAGLVTAQQSPKAETSAMVGGKTVTIKYSAPSVRGRKMFGDGGRISQDPTYPVWRAGANSATSLHTDADLMIGNLSVPKGDYTLFVNVKDPDAWELIVNKQTGQWGLSYKGSEDLGRTKMTMSKPPAPIETFKITLSPTTLEMAWENHVATVPLMVK